MRRIVTLLFAAAAATLLVASPASGSAQTFTDNEKIPFNFFFFVPCAAGGAGEFVTFEGSLHALFHATVDSAGGFHSTSHFNPQGVSGVGETTGDSYHGTGVTRSTFNGKVGSVSTLVNNFRLIGQGPGNNFLVHAVLHVTVNANGTVTAVVDSASEECK